MMDNFNKEEILNILIEILKSDDPTKNLTRLLSRTAEILEADAATIVIWTGNLGVFHSTVNIPPEIPLRGRILSPDRGGLDGRLFNNQERIWIQLSNYSKNMDALPVLKPANFYLAVGGIINIRQSELTATICFYYKERTKKFQEEELKYFPIILTQLGIAILNAHLQQEFLSISELNQETTNFLDILVNSNPDIIINLDVNGKIKLWNDVAEKVLKYSAHEIINKFLPLKKGENEEKFINFLSEARKGKFIQNQELIFVPKKDSMNHKLINELIVEVSIIPINNQKGELESLLLTGRDITKTKDLQTKLHESSLKLNQKNIALSIKEQQLSQAQKELITAEKLASIGSIISKLNHQINNPLMSLLSLISLSLDDIKDWEENHLNKEIIDENLLNIKKELQNQLNEAINQGNRIREVLKKVRYFSEIATEKHFRDNTNLLEVISQSLQNFKNSEYANHMDISFISELEIALVYGNFKQLQFVISALIENAILAIEFNKEKEIRGKIELVLKPINLNKRRFYRFEISDNGIGITPEQKEHLYDPFYSNWPSPEMHVGLSLAIVKLIAINHNAYITVCSQEEEDSMFFNFNIQRGTKFILDFPSI
ncbi:MAG: hypothetical protein DRO88_08460 [Promethearchaeia archaeon]|nr:MAG: hypothetical protein DRO88_08460 [Candidatus Lokiarchaeia archaeon]